MQTNTLPRFAFIILALFAGTAAAQDIRDKVAVPAAVTKVSALIDPDSSIYGIPFGTTEDQFIAQFGKPMGYVRLSGEITGMIYGRAHCFLFVSGQLAGVRINYSVLDWKLNELGVSPSIFDQTKWHLSNGLSKDMSLREVKEIVGDQLSTDRYRRSFSSQKSKVDLDFSHLASASENDDASYKLSAIMISPR